MPRQGKGHNLGPGRMPGPGKVRPFPEMVTQGTEKSQRRKSRNSIREKEKQCRRKGDAEREGARAAEIGRVSS